MAADPYAFWNAVLAGAQPELQRDVMVAGRFWKRLRSGDIIGIAIDPNEDDDGYAVRIGKNAPFDIRTFEQIQDFCEEWLSWIARNAVTHEAYLHWWKTGEWPEGAIKERPKESRSRKVAEAHSAPVTANVETASSQATAAPAIRVRTYASIGASDPGEAFYARAIRYAKGRETTSVGFYGDTAEAAVTKAIAWVDAERGKAERASPRRKPASPETSAAA